MGNSVIYRPAYDAEVEYLESTGTQWIDTGFTAEGGCIVEYDCIHKSYNGGVIVGSHNPSDNTDNGYNRNMAFIYNSESVKFNKCDDYESLPYVCELNTRHTWYFNTIGYNRIGKIDGNVVVNATTTSVLHPVNNIVIFFSQYNLIVSSGVIYNLKIKSADNVLVRDMIPVRIGSIGYMYDKVSKQLFANKGTGNFILGNDVSNAVIPQQRCVLYFGNQRSVGFERIYEEYEWLCGDGSANFNKSINFQSAKWELSNVTKYASLNVFEFNAETYGAFQIVAYPYNRTGIGIYDNTGGRGYLYTDVEDVNVIEIKSQTTSNSIVINETDFSNPTLQIKPNFVLNGIVRAGGIKCSSITVDGSVRYVPCKLLQSIPAILDGNGIARQAGECGMWDKVSNKFYGNVASSGTFTVKGPKCYEEYKWLVADIPIGVAMMSLPINSSTFNCTIEHTGARANLPHLYSNGYIYFTNSSNMDMIAVWNVSKENIPFSASVGSLMVIESNEEYFKVNNISIPKYGFPILRMVIQSSYNSNNATSTKTSSITIDGIERYIPCKLTHGIPASMDANGIARPAGTCGMWDKVNDKFYGNVASSSTFTVSND